MKLGWDDYFWWLVRTLAYIAAIYYLGWIIGIAAIVVFNYTHGFVFYCFFGLEGCDAMDELFLLDHPLNRSTITAAVICSKYDLEKMMAQFKRNGFKYNRMRSKIIKVAGRYYWKKMTSKEMSDLEPTYILDGRDLNLHSEDALGAFMAK